MHRLPPDGDLESQQAFATNDDPDKQFKKYCKSMPCWLKLLIWLYSLIPALATVASTVLLLYLGGHPKWVFGASFCMLIVWLGHLSLQFWQHRPKYRKLEAEALAAIGGTRDGMSFQSLTSQLQETSNRMQYDKQFEDAAVFKRQAYMTQQNKYTIWYILFAHIAGTSLKAVWGLLVAVLLFLVRLFGSTDLPNFLVYSPILIPLIALGLGTGADALALAADGYLPERDTSPQPAYYPFRCD